MSKWKGLLSKTPSPLPDGLSDGASPPPLVREASISGAGPPDRATLSEPSIRFANLKQKLQLIKKGGRSNFNLEAMSDLVEEARFNKSAILDDTSAATELKQLLQMTWLTRRAVHLREITEFGRNIEFPPSWHGTDRNNLCVWYHCLPYLKVAEFQPGQVITRNGNMGQHAFWILEGKATVFTDAALQEKEDREAAEAAERAAREAAEAAAAAAAAIISPTSSTASTPRRPPPLNSNLNGSNRHSTRLSGIVGANKRDSSAGSVPLPGLQIPLTPVMPSPSLKPPARESVAGVAASTPKLAIPAHMLQGACASPTARRSMAGKPGSTDPLFDSIEFKLWDLFGEEALIRQPYSLNVVAGTETVVCVSLSLDDYQAALARMEGQTFESLKFIHLMLMSKAKRTPKELQSLADHLSLFGLFKSLEPEVRLEVCNLVEYVYCPAGFTLFEQGDKIDFCYVVLHGEVAFTRYDDKTGKQEDLGVKTTGDHFGTLTTLASGDRKRPFTGVTSVPCELAVISRVGYNRVLKKNLQYAIDRRVALFQELSVMKSSTVTALQKVATHCQDELYSAGCVVVDPDVAPNRIFFILSGEAKLVWVTDNPNKLPAKQEPSTQKYGAFGTGSQDAATTAQERADKAAREAAYNTQQQLGSTTFSSATKMACGRKRTTIELAQLVKGDVINGIVLLGMSPVFHVVATSQLKLVSMEIENVEACLGRESCRLLRELILESHEWSMQHLAHVVSVRQTVGNIIMDPAVHRTMQQKELKHFMDHYVPRNLQELREAETANDPNAEGSLRTLPSVQTLDDCLRIPAATHKGVMHEEPRGARRRHRSPRTTREPGYASSPPRPAADPSSSSTTHLATDPSHSQAHTHTTLSTSHSLAPSTQSRRSKHHHLGTQVGVNVKRRKGKHMAFAGGMATALLDLTTEPSVVMTSSLTSFRSVLLDRVSYGDASPVPSQGEGSTGHTPLPGHVHLPRLDLPSVSEAQHGHGVPFSPLHSGRQVASVGVSVQGGKGAVGGMSRSLNPGGMSPGRQRDAMQAAGLAHPAAPHGDAWGSMGGSLHADASELMFPPSAAGGANASLDAEVAAVLARHASHHAQHNTMTVSLVPLAESSATSPVPEGYYDPQYQQYQQYSAQQWDSSGMQQTLGGNASGGGGEASVLNIDGKLSRSHQPLYSPLPKLHNAPSPVLVSPALKSKVLVQPVNSGQTAKYTRHRKAAMLSGFLTPDGNLQPSSPRPAVSDGADNAAAAAADARDAAAQRPSRDTAGHVKHTAFMGYSAHDLAALEPSASEPTVVILPEMMNVYQSVIPTKHGVVLCHARTARRAQSQSGSPPRTRIPAARQGATVPAQSDVSHATAPGDTSSFTTHNNSASISDDRPQSAGGKSESDGVSLKALALSIRAFNEIVTPLPTARRNQNGSFVAAGNTSRLASRKSLTRRPSTRCESVTNQQGPQGNIMRLIATAHDHEPPLPLDCDHTAPPLRDHKLSQPTLDDIGYLLRRWGTRWASEREDILHKRHERGVAIPHGLSPRTMDRVLHSEHSVWEKEFERSTEDARQFGWPASGPHSLAGAAGALTARLRQQ